MAGPRFDWGRFMETGGKFAYEILSEQKKYKNKMDEIEAQIRADTQEKEKERQDNFIESGMGFIENIITSGKFNVETNRAIYQSGLEMGLPLPPLPGMAPVPTGMPTAGVEGLYGEGGYTPPEPTMQLFGAPVEEPKERAYGFTQKEFETKEKFKAKLKGPSVAERKLGLNAQQVAAALERGLKITKEALTGRVTSIPIGGTLKGVTKAATKEDAIRASIEMGWAPGTPEYQQHIAGAIDKWWETEGKFDVLKKDPTVRKQVRSILKKNKVKPTEENIDKFIVNNYDKLME